MISHQEQDFIKYIFILMLQLLSVMLMLIFTFLEPFIAKHNFIKNFSLLLSRQTYSIYLMHIIFIYLLNKIEFSLLIANVIYLPSLFIVSLLIFNYIEKPLLSLRPKMK